MPKITIITITFNLIKNGRKDWFIQNLESVHNQTYHDIEHIIIDGASTDGTVELLEEYQNKGYIKYYSKPDDGIYDAMNKGLQHAAGEYITYLNSDDFYHDYHIISNVANLLKKTDAEFLYGNALMVNEDGSKYSVQKSIPELFFVHMPFSHQALFVKTTMMKKLGGFDLTFKSAGDFDFIIRMFMSGAYGVELPNLLVSFRLGGMSYKQIDLSRREVAVAFNKNYSPLIEEDVDFLKMYMEQYVPKQLFEKIKSTVHKKFMSSMGRLYKKSKDCKDGYVKIPLNNMKSCDTKLLLFDCIQIFKFSKYKNKVKIYLFGLPCFYKKTTQTDTVYRVLSIPVFTIKQSLNKRTFCLYKIPIFSYKN